MMDDPYKFIRDILVNSPEITKVIPASNIKNFSIPTTLITQPPYIRITVIDVSDEEFGDGQILAGGLKIQIDIWQNNGLLTVGNKIKKLFKEKDIYCVDVLEPHAEKINDSLTLFRDGRRYFYAYELEENEIY